MKVRTSTTMTDTIAQLARYALTTHILFFSTTAAANQNSIQVLYTENDPPYSFADGTRHPRGFTIDICRRVIASLTRKHRFTDEPFWTPDREYSKTKTSGYSTVLDCRVNRTASELGPINKDLAPYLITGLKAAGPANTSATGITELTAARIAVSRRSVAGAALSEMNSRAGLRFRLLPVESHQYAARTVLEGKADALVVEDWAIAEILRDPEFSEKLRVFAHYIRIDVLTIELLKGTPQQRALVSEVVAEVLAGGEIYSLFSAWFTAPNEIFNRGLGQSPSTLNRSLWQTPRSLNARN